MGSPERRELARRAPFARGLWPSRLTELYDFVGEQDLIGCRVRRHVLAPGSHRRVRSALGKVAPGPRREWLLGYAALCAGRYALALKHLAGAQVLPRARLLKAAAYWLRGDRERSRRWLPQALAAADAAVGACGPTREALLLRAQIRFEFEDNAGGLADLGKILRADPMDLRARIGRAEVLGDLYDYAGACREMAKVLAARPGAWWALAQRGRLRGMCGKPEGALRDLGAAIARRPACGALYSWRAEVLRRVGRHGEALADCSEAIRRDPGYAFSWELRGRLRLARGEPRPALGDLSRACLLDPSHQMAFAWRAQARLELGLSKGAWEDLDRVFPMDPGGFWIATGPDRQGALRQDIEAALARRPRDPWARLLRGRWHALAGRWAGALGDLTSGVRLAEGRDPKASAAGRRWRGWVLGRLGRGWAAEAELGLAAKLDARDRQARCWRAQVLASLGRGREAMEEYRRGLNGPTPAFLEGYLGRADLHMRARRWDLAAADYQTALICDARSAAARNGLAQAQRRARREGAL